MLGIETRLHTTLPAHPPAALNVPLCLGGRGLGKQGPPCPEESGAGPREGPTAWTAHVSLASGRLRVSEAAGLAQVQGCQRGPGSPQDKGSWRAAESKRSSCLCWGLSQCLAHLLIHEDGSRLGATRQLTQLRSARSKVRTSPEQSPEVQKTCTWKTLLSSHDGDSSQECCQD